MWRTAESASFVSPVADGAVVVPELRVFPVVAQLFRHRFLVQLDPETGAGRQRHGAVDHPERLLEVAFAKSGVLLDEEVWDAGVQLDAGGEGDRAERVMGRHGGVIG